MNDAQQPPENDHRATQGLDPGPVDEACSVVAVTTSDGRTVPVSLRTVAPLTEAEQAMLGEIVQAVVDLDRRVNPHGGVITELMLASSAACRAMPADDSPWGRSRDLAAVKARLRSAAKLAGDAIRAASAPAPMPRREEESETEEWERGKQLDQARVQLAGMSSMAVQARDFNARQQDRLHRAIAVAVGRDPDAVWPGNDVVFAELEQLRAELAEWKQAATAEADIGGEDGAELARLRDTVRQVTDLLALPAHLVVGGPAPSVVDLARWARAARDSFDQRLGDIQAEMAKRDAVHDRDIAKRNQALADAASERESRFRWAQRATDLTEQGTELVTRTEQQDGIIARQKVRLEQLFAANEQLRAGSGEAGARRIRDLERDLAGLRERAIVLPDDWERQLDEVECSGASGVQLVESWRPAPSGWDCECGTDATDMVHTAERCYSATEPVATPVSAIVHRATGERTEYPQRPRTHEGHGKGPVD